MEQDDPQPEGEAAELAQATADDGIDWQAIKHDVIHSDRSYSRIAAQYGSSDTTIKRRAKKYGWARLVPTKRLPGGRALWLPGAPKEKRATRNDARRRQLLDRLFRVMDGKMREIEKRMSDANQNGGPLQSAADAERDARSLTAFARLYAKVVELDDAAREKRAGEANKTMSVKETSQDADGLRQDLALRLKRLARPGDA